jgi:hypothetical protein
MINVNDSAAKVNDGVIGPGRRAAAPVRMIARRLQFLRIVERRGGFAEQRDGLSGVWPEIAFRSGESASGETRCVKLDRKTQFDRTPKSPSDSPS